jgi:multiple sugar transport system ATP-binding protein
MGDIPLSDRLRRSLEQHGTGRRDVIIGVRPEDFEDANFAPDGHEGWTFEAPIELTESMGSEIYAHFDFAGGAVETEELRELQEDAGTSDVPQSGASGHAVARVDANSAVRAGQSTKLWLDVRKLHIFDPSDGSSLTRPREQEPAAAPA